MKIASGSPRQMSRRRRPSSPSSHADTRDTLSPEVHYPSSLVGRNFDFEDGEDLPESPGAAYPKGPVPPHERIWRHPSELGFAAVTAADAATVNIGRTGRSLLGISTVGVTILMVVMFAALQPTSPNPVAQDVIALTNSQIHVASFHHPGLITVETNSDLADPPRRRMNDAVGIMPPNGQFLITTMAAIAEVETIDVRLTGGRIVQARVVQTYPDISIAVLSVSEQPSSTAFPDIDVMSIVPRGVKFAKGQVVMALVDIPRQLIVSDRISDVFVSLRSSTMTAGDLANVSEGAPIVDKSGQLVGICTRIDGVLSFIPFVYIEKALASWITDADVAGKGKSR